MRDFGSRGVGLRSARRQRARMLRWALSPILLGCVLDPDDRCAPFQTLWTDDERCVCEAGAAYTPTGCVPCGENEVVTPSGCGCAAGFGRATPADRCAPCGEHEVTSPNGCICEAGFSRAAPGEPCAQPEGGGAGSPCARNAECLNPTYSHCEVRNAGGYCTNENCTTSADCAQGFTCVTSSSPSVCRLPPDGAGRPCTGPQDCIGSEAEYCDIFFSGSCLVQNCSLEPDNCFPGMECCDVGNGIPPLCIPAGACQT